MAGQDDDDTLRKHPRRPSNHWDDDRRALESSDRRRATQRAIPVPVAPRDDLTPVFDLLEEPASDDVIRAVERSRRDSQAPVGILDFAKLFEHVNKHLKRLGEREDSNNQERTKQLVELFNRPPDERVAELERTVEQHRKILRWIAGAVLASLAAVASFIYSRGLNEGGAAVKLEHVEKAVEELRARVFERRSAIDPPLPAIAPDAVSTITPQEDP